MKPALLLLIPFCLLSVDVIGQHCPWDNGYIMILDVHSATDTSIIPNLKITIVDGYGNPVVSWSSGEVIGTNFIGDTLRFRKNPQENTDTMIAENKNSVNSPPYLYWFAEDKYIHVTGDLAELLRNPRIKIEDADGEQNGGYYKTTIIDIHKSDFHSLCIGRNRWTDGRRKEKESSGLIDVEYRDIMNYFKPVQVVLEKNI